VDLDEDVYAYIAKQTSVIGESASDILRRLLSVPGESPVGQKQSQPGGHELTEVLAHPIFHSKSTAVNRTLFLLSEIYKAKGKEFEKVLSFGGRDRRYFGKSREEISKTGRSTYPQRIPGTPYWFMTNSPTPAKIALLDDVMRALGYSSVAIDAVKKAMKNS